jgi:hypothetical protein
MPSTFLVLSALMILLSGFYGATSSVTVTKAPIKEPEGLEGQMLAGENLIKAKLKGARLGKAMLAGTDLRQANLESADVSGAMLIGANLSGANVMNANFSEAMMLGAHLDGARIEGANFRNTAFLSQEQIDVACGKPIALPEGLKAPKEC